MPRAVDLDTTEFRQFQRDLRGIDKDLAKELNKVLRDLLTANIIPAAKSNAAWSSRIPGAIKPQVTTTRLGARVGRKFAPHARPFEGIGGSGSFRHPVFGNRDVWVSQPTRPFIAPAFAKHGDAALKAAGEAVDAAGRKAGFR